MKICSTCKIEKEDKNFRLRNDRSKWSLRSICRSCDNIKWRKWYANNKEKRKQYKQQEWYKEQSCQYAKDYREEHLKERAFWQRRRIVAKMQNGGSHTFQEWENLKRKFNYTCLSCGKKEPEIKVTADHIIPLKKGGNDNITNIQPLCQICNSKKQEINFIKLYAQT
jgi:5-methylcytosine-specific restriction endonuclease McrA